MYQQLLSDIYNMSCLATCCMVIIVSDVKLYHDDCDSTKICLSVGVHDACSLEEISEQENMQCL